jgi:hypothetical protein
MDFLDDGEPLNSEWAPLATNTELFYSQDFFGEQYLEMQTYNAHGNCFYMYLKSISTLLYVKIPYSDYLDLQTDIRAK